MIKHFTSSSFFHTVLVNKNHAKKTDPFRNAHVIPEKYFLKNPIIFAVPLKKPHRILN